MLLGPLDPLEEVVGQEEVRLQEAQEVVDSNLAPLLLLLRIQGLLEDFWVDLVDCLDMVVPTQFLLLLPQREEVVEAQRHRSNSKDWQEILGQRSVVEHVDALYTAHAASAKKIAAHPQN